MIKIKSFWYKMIWFSPQKGKENKQTKFSNRFWLMIVKVKMKISDLILYQSKIGEKNENQKTKKNCISLTGCHKQQQQQYFDDKLDTNKRNDRKTKMKKKMTEWIQTWRQNDKKLSNVKNRNKNNNNIDGRLGRQACKIMKLSSFIIIKFKPKTKTSK